MSRIEIDPEAIIEATKRSVKAESTVNEVDDLLRNVMYCIDPKIKSRRNIEAKLKSVCGRLADIEAKLDRLNSVVPTSARLYRDTDSKIRSEANDIPEISCIGVATVASSVGASATNTVSGVNAASSGQTVSSVGYAVSTDTATGSGGTYSSSSNTKSFSTVHREEDEIWVEVPLCGQNTDYSCGAAAGNMILAALGVNCNETSFWNYANANGQGDYVYRIAQTLNHFIGSNKYDFVYTADMSLEEYYLMFVKSLENGYPVEVVMSVKGKSELGYTTSGHYVVVTGVYKNEDGEYIAKINDPFSANWYGNGHQGQQIEMRLSDLHRYNKKHSSYIICNT